MKRNSRILQWAYLLDEDGPPWSRVSLCALFWRTVFWTPIRLLALIGMLGAVVLVIAGVILALWRTPVLLLVPFGAIALGALSVGILVLTRL